MKSVVSGERSSLSHGPTDNDAADTDVLTTTLRPEPADATMVIDPAQQALEEHQRSRAARGATMICGVALFGVVALQFVQKPGPAHGILSVALVALAAVALVQLVRVRRGLAYDRSYIAIAAALVDLAAAAYVGLFSLVTVPLPIIILFTGQDRRRGHAWAVYLTCAVGVLVVAGVAATGHLDLTQSLLALEAPPGRRLISLTAFIELVLGVSFAMATSFRRSSEQALRDLARAHGEIQDRDALLDRARADVERLDAANRAARYSGRRVGPFRVGDLVGQGGMGDVYVAEHVEDGRTVALKILHEHLREEADAVQRFFREARVTSELDSVHIANVLMTGTSEEGAPFLAMEYLRGRDLSAILRQRTTLSLDETVTLVLQVTHALSRAHRAGIVHRDIKPHNLFLCASADGSPCWKVLDFGISKITGIASTLTADKIIGTPGYMAPEQARGQPVDARADICSLAIVAYRALTGRPAFRGKDSKAVIANLLLSMPLAPSAVADVPDDVDLVLAVALAKERDDRFDTIDDFAKAFEAAAGARLGPSVRRRARARIEAHPWGTETTRSLDPSSARRLSAQVAC